MQSTIKNAIYKDYVDDMHRRYQQEPIASLATFYETWRVVFPHCQIRPYCQILGKCDDCADIDYIKRTEVDPDKLMAAAELHSVHRGGKFMLERSAYMRRKKYAMEHPDRVMSIIIDKMDQSHCVVPYKGTQTQLNHALKIGLTGVKEHGVGVTFYRTIDSVAKGANLTIHCIAMQLESWILRHDDKVPEEIFVQVSCHFRTLQVTKYYV